MREQKNKIILAVEEVTENHISNGCWWLTSVVQLLRRQRSGGSQFQAWANSSQVSISKKPFTKTGLVVWLKVKALRFTPQYHGKKKITRVCKTILRGFVLTQFSESR
jgi:hypothetical protein